MSHSLWDRKESDTAKRLTQTNRTDFIRSYIFAFLTHFEVSICLADQCLFYLDGCKVINY